MIRSTVVTELENIPALSDAEVAARWLNASKGTRSHSRVLAIREQLERLRSGLDLLQKQRQDLGAKGIDLFKRNKGQTAVRVLAKDGAAHQRLWRQLNREHRKLNEALSRYVFRLSVGYTVITDSRRAGLLPNNEKSYFQMKLDDGSILYEPDAVMSLVRLFLINELHRVRLCEMCKQRWRVAAKSHYRFCSPECRQAFHISADDYNERKARNQKEYRERLKRKELAEAGALKRL
jgi:hypothetical protein